VSTDWNWFVFDPSPIDSDHARIYGPYETKWDADEAANEAHPDDGSGDCITFDIRDVFGLPKE